MKKILLVLVLCVALVFTLVACNKNGGENVTTDDTTTATEETTVDTSVETESEKTTEADTTTEAETTEAETENTSAPETTVEDTTEAPETTVADTTTEVPETTTEVPETTVEDTTTEAPETTVEDTTEAPQTTVEDTTTEAPETTVEDTTTEAPETTEEDTPAETETTVSEETESNEETSEETTEEATTEDETAIVKVTISHKNISRYVVGANQTTVSTYTAEGGSFLSLLTNTANANDPYVTFNFSSYMTAIKRDQINANVYKFVILKMKAVNCSNSTFEMYYSAGSVTGAIPGCNISTAFDNYDEEWQYIYFDLSDKNWSGRVNNFRFDYMFAGQNAGEGVIISQIIFATDYENACKAMGVTPSTGGVEKLPEEEQAKVDELLSGTIAGGEYPTYVPEVAEKEDSNLTLWFDHTYTRTPQNQMIPSSYAKYRMTLAKNEIEACQLIIASTEAKNGLRIEVSDFIHSNGKSTMKSDVLMGYYFDIKGQNVIDPLPPIEGNFSTFNLAANTNQTFVIKAKSMRSTDAGEYSATVKFYDAEGNVVKTIKVFAYVWNFELAEDTSCKTLVDLDATSIYTVNAGRYNIEFGENFYSSDVYNQLVDFDPYKAYYDFLLENRLCAYTVPGIDKNGVYTGTALAYMENPRVVAFLNLGWKTDLNATNVENSYNSLAGKTDAAGNPLLGKAYFYPVDEPGNIAGLDKINAAADLIKQYYGTDYKLIAPIHLNSEIGTEGNMDYFEYVKDSVTAWCPKTHFYTSYSEFKLNRNLTYKLTTRLEHNLGTFAERMEAEKLGGDETWWYVTRNPNNPELTVLTQQDAVSYRTLFWQQKLYDVDGFLYYAVNDWAVGTDPRAAKNDNHVELCNEYDRTGAWYSKHEISAAQNMDVYGNGILLYPGHMVDWYYFNPVGSLRLECVRDGIEDYEYLTMLEELIGKEKVDLIISTITTSVTEYTVDADLFMQIREAVGVLLETEINK